MELTHASFFSGVGGLDLGLERAGWRTVSFSEIDPYASAVLAERWPGIPNLGDIVALASVRDERLQRERRSEPSPDSPSVLRSPEQSGAGRVPWIAATLWSGGFPCQDLSVAGKRAGFGLQVAGRPNDASPVGRYDRASVSESDDGSDGGPAFDVATRSGLAFAFLDLVEQHRPPAILLENVPGLLSSNGGKDFGALLSRLAELGYWWAYRILDAQHFGVPQRRRRVFVVALHAGAGFGADSAAAVLSVGARCEGHSAAGDEAGEGAAERTTVGAIPAGVHGFPDGVQEFMQGHFRVAGPPSDSGGVRAPDGLAGRIHHREPMGISENQRGEVLLTEISHQLTSGGGKPGQGYPAVLSPTLRVGPARLLPLGLDSHRYRCCGNGVVSNVSEWVGWRLRWAVEGMKAAA